MGFCIIGKNKLCDKHKFMTFAFFVQCDNLHMNTLLCSLKCKCNFQKQEAIVRL